MVFPGATQGVYTFTSLANFQSGNYSQFQQAFGTPFQKQKNPNFGVFAQDEWKPRKNLMLNFGLRYDLQDLPAPIKTDTNNIAPRFGFAYSPDEKTVVRGGFELYYDRVPLRATSNALQRDGSKYTVAILSRTSPNAPVFPNVLASQPSVLTIKPSVTRIDPEIQNSSSEQANLQIERELPFDASVSVGYLYLRGLHIILSRNVNVPRCLSAIDSNLCRPDPNFGNISRGERGLSDNDQRHRLTISGTFNAPKTFENKFARNIFGGFQASYIFTYASRLPFNVLAGQDSTHITFGVLTAGYVYDKFKFEVSAFNGSEPDENRWNFDRPRFNSFSGRLSWNPTKEWSFQVSHGYLRNPEPNTLYINCYALPYIISLQPKSCRDERRTTASAIYNKNFGNDRNWANSFVWGQKTNVDYKHDNAFLYETNYQFQKNAVFSRLEWVQKNSHELALVNPHPPGIHWVGAYSAGYMRDLIRDKGIDVGLGAQATLYRNSPVFSSYYGGQTHGGFQIFMRFRPSRMNH
ncbi:MAG: TonB-dependent receptor domain-containing protein [Pyrinomonadaceae bacterium]